MSCCCVWSACCCCVCWHWPRDLSIILLVTWRWHRAGHVTCQSVCWSRDVEMALCVVCASFTGHVTELVFSHSDVCKSLDVLCYQTLICTLLRCLPVAFSALTLLVGRQEGHPACKKQSGGVLVWLSVWSEVQACIWLSWCHCHSLSLASVKSRLVLPFWYRLTWVVPEKGPLNGCCVVRCLPTSVVSKCN